MDLPPRPELFDFCGVSMTHYFTNNWENIQNFQARPDDILIATYPKAGQYAQAVSINGSTAHDKFVNRAEQLRFYFPLSACVFLLGTTWVSLILDLLYFGKTAPERQTSIPIEHRVPFLEINIPSMFQGWKDDRTYAP